MPILKVANIHFNAAGTTRFEYRNDNVIRANANSFVLPISSATTANDTGAIRYNSSTSVFEGNNGSGWQILSGVGSAYDKANLALSQANAMVISANSWANQVGVSANTYADNKFIANTNATVNGSLTMTNVIAGNNSNNLNISAQGINYNNTSPAYLLANIMYITANTGINSALTLPPKTRAFLLEACGGGGGGGSVFARGVNDDAYGHASSGGGGGYARVFVENMNQTFTYTLGDRGACSNTGNANASNGGTTTVYGSSTGLIVRCVGGEGGKSTNTRGGFIKNILGGRGSTSTKSSSVSGITLDGSDAENSIISAGNVIVSFSKSGAAPVFGGGITAILDDSVHRSSARNARNYGEGGAGAIAQDAGVSSQTIPGGDGEYGVIIVTSYI